MKLSLAIKLALAGSTLLAASAYADVATPVTGNGELVLFVRDNTTNTTYGRGLGVNTLDVLPQTTVTANQPYTAPVATGYQLSTLAPDANLVAFLGGTHANDNFTWAVEGGKNGTGIAPGSFTYITTTHIDLSTGTTVTNANLATVYPGLTSTYNALNGQIASGVIGDKASTAAGRDGQWGNIPGNDNWYGVGPDTSGTLVGSAQNFYGLTTAGTTKSSPAEVFVLNQLTLGKDGTLTAAGGGGAPVPLPAAVWLLGSGLLGLFGVGRRRNAAAAV
jgi:hypothetical protein